MPGPLSDPKAKLPDGRVVTGKSALARLGLKSGQGFEFDRTGHSNSQEQTHGHA